MDRNRMISNGRPSGIRPPSTYKHVPSGIPRQTRLPSDSSMSSISASTGKRPGTGAFKPQTFGSGGLGMNRPSGAFQNRTSNVFALPKFGLSSGRKSSIAGRNNNMGLFGMTPQTNKR